MNRLMQFFRSFRTLILIGALAAPMLPLPGLTSSAVADEVPVGADTSLNGNSWKTGVGIPCGWFWCGATPVFHALADVNGDGFSDLIYTVAHSSNVYVQYSNGSTFGAPVVVASDSSNTAASCNNKGCNTVAQAWINAVGDVNGDGLPDILFADGTVALANGSGFGPKIAWGGDTSLNGNSWKTGVGIPCGWFWCGATPVFHALADVNGDGFSDLIYTVAHSSNVYVQYSNGSTFGAPVVVASDSSNTAASCNNIGCNTMAQAWINAVGDVNGDGQKDLLFANGSVSTVLKPTSLLPKYLIGSVSYVPPGGSGTGSKITYAVGAVTGSTITTKNSWTASSTISGGASIFGDTETVSFGLAFGGSDSTSVDMQQTMTLTVPYSQPPSDVINHDYDVIQLYFGVVVNGTRDYTGDHVTLSLDFSKMLAEEFSVDGYNVPVGCFRSGSSIYGLQFCVDWQNLFLDTGPGQANKFQLTLDDFPNIVGADPYADPATTPSTPDAVPGRYVLLTNFPYQPTFSGDNPATWAVTNSSTTTNTNTSTVTYTVGLKDELQSDPLGLLSGKLTIDNKFTWTQESDSSNKTGSTSASTLTLAAPTVPVAPTGVVNVYMDTVFKRFMFWIPTN